VDAACVWGEFVRHGERGDAHRRVRGRAASVARLWRSPTAAGISWPRRRIGRQRDADREHGEADVPDRHVHDRLTQSAPAARFATRPTSDRAVSAATVGTCQSATSNSPRPARYGLT
jgi:hypothetical protein